jgi:hypothetical protein
MAAKRLEALRRDRRHFHGIEDLPQMGLARAIGRQLAEVEPAGLGSVGLRQEEEGKEKR